MYHQLGNDAPLKEAAALRSAVDAAVESKQGLTVGLDEAASLDAALLNALITGLRRLREIGATMRLHVTRPDLLRSLDVTGLNRVFEVIALPEASPKAAPLKPQPRKRKLADGLAAIAAALLVLSSTLAALAQGGTAVIATELTPPQIVEKIVERNPALHSFQAHVDIRLHTGIPLLNPALEGTTYFKRPDNYEVVFTKIPSYARGIEKLYGDIGDPADWDKRFVLSAAGDQDYDGHRDVMLRLVQRVRGMIDHEDVLVDTVTWTVEKMTYYYYNGGVISLEQRYRDEGGFQVLSDQRAIITLPHIPRTIATAHYSAYRMNVAIDDAVFTLKQTKEMGTK